MTNRPRRIAWIGRALAIRLRFPILLGLALLAVSQWDLLRAYWAKLMSGGAAAAQAVSADTEYFCPMDPGVLSDWPSKCPVCNMALVRRKKGDATPLPEGVIARMQFSPYRVQLAGIGTVPVDYRSLMRETRGPARMIEGKDSPAWLVDLFAREAEGIVPGRSARLVDPAGREYDAEVADIEIEGVHARARLLLADAEQPPAPGTSLRGVIEVPVASLEPFRSLPSDPPKLRPKELRRLYRCPDHPEIVRDRTGTCPHDRGKLIPQELAENQRVRWWCPMHPDVVADEPGKSCEACNGMILVPRVISYRPPGQVLTIPEASVVDTGARRVVYVERMPGMFDGVEVTLGPRCGPAYPVIAGLEPGQRVVSSGAFLVDAEARLDPNAAAGYFGASRSVEAKAALSAPPDDAPPLSAEDKAKIAHQKICPVTGMDLGSMGAPARMVIRGRTVFLCCEGCQPMVEDDPDTYLAKIPAEPTATPRPRP